MQGNHFNGSGSPYPNKKFYTPGVEHIDKEQIEGKINQAVLEVENVSGGKNPTTLAMLNTLRDIEFLLELYQNRGIEFINTSKQGALIKGTTFKTIEEVYTTINDIHLEDDWFKNELNRYLRPYSEQRKQRIINKAKKAVSKLKELKEQAEQLLKFIDQLNEMKHQQKSLSQLLNKIGKDWDKIYKSIEFEKIYRFVLQGHISVYVRVLPQIQNQPNLYTRADLIYKHLED